jgi:NDP-sugar pyrophosphorylase family protein
LYSEESTPLGTAGAIRFALSYSKTKNALVINGDTVFDIDLEKLKEQHLKSGAVFTIALKNNKENSKYGVVELNKNNDIIKFQEKTQSSGLINGGIYFVNKEKFEKIVDNKFGKRPLSLEKDVFPYLATKRSLKGVVLTGTFIDIGTPDSYKEATKILKK